MKNRNHALLALVATAAAIGSVIILVRSAMKGNVESDTTSIVIAVILMSVGVVLAHYVKKKKKEEEIAAEIGTAEPIDEELQKLLDYFYDMEREDEFYSCMENGGPIENFNESVKEFRATREKALAQGSTEYIWRTSRDQDVCLFCRRNNGKRFVWKNLIAGDHPGCAPGCRCKAEPVLPEATRKNKPARNVK